jgi:hypothetical protein
MYLCIYNSATKEILYPIEDNDPIRTPFTHEAMRLQALCQGPEWTPYFDSTPFAFPVDNPS